MIESGSARLVLNLSLEVKKLTCFAIVFIVLSSLGYPSDSTLQIDWLKNKTIPTQKLSQEEFEELLPLFSALLEKRILKEDVFAILNYLLRENFIFEEQLLVFKKIISVLDDKDIDSKTLRNFISNRIKTGKINGKRKSELTSFLIEELDNLDVENRYKEREYEVIQGPFAP